MNSTNLKSEFNYKIPSKANNLSDGEVEILRQNENYLAYIKEREKYNNLTKEFELALVENRILKEKINKIIIESQSIEINSELNNLGNQLIENEQVIKTKQNQLNDQFDKLSSIENSSQFEWLLANGKQPSTFLASRDNTNRIQTNFTIGKTPSVSIDKPLPVNLNSPSGLIYRVQVGAYRKPIPKEAFRDFSPVSGETLTNGLTCYMAGYFNSAQNAINARKQIRALGYTDAFIVAYCDGKRLTFAKGRELEISGQCKALSENELILALNQTVSNDEKNNNETQIQTTNSITQDYLNIPNIKEAEYGENSQHLFFTVQVGVFNKPITNNQLKQFDDLVTFKTENGQFRYSSGMFENVNDAKNHKIQANVKGVPDAYVVAYYKGKRISIAEANNLIAINGTDILKKSSPVVNSEITNNIISKDNFVELNIELPVVTNLVNSDSLIQFSLDCNTEEVIPNLEKLNRIGIFSYQQEYGRIISSKMKKAEVTNVHNEYFKDFETKIQQVDSTKIIELDVSNKLSEGSFTDWLLRSYLNHRFESNEEQKKLNIYLENDFQRNEIKRKAEELKISILNE